MKGRSHPLWQEPSWEGDWREVARREGDGLDITLLWSGSAERVKVTVFDERCDAVSKSKSKSKSKSTSTAQMLERLRAPVRVIAAGATVRPRQPLQQQTV